MYHNDSNLGAALTNTKAMPRAKPLEISYRPWLLVITEPNRYEWINWFSLAQLCPMCMHLDLAVAAFKLY